MSEEHQQPQTQSAWQEAEAEGMDMSLIECNLRRTVWERMVIHDRALSFALELRQAMQRRETDGAA